MIFLSFFLSVQADACLLAVVYGKLKRRFVFVDVKESESIDS